MLHPLVLFPELVGQWESGEKLGGALGGQETCLQYGEKDVEKHRLDGVHLH
jgi:biotin operon repressor